MQDRHKRNPLTYQEIQECLYFISPEQDYDTWARVGRALHSEFGDKNGFALFDNWSSGGANYQKKAIREQWKSFRNTDRVTLGTVIYLAKQGGWAPVRDAGQNRDFTVKKDQEKERQRRAEEVKARQEAEANTRAKGLKDIYSQFKQLPRLKSPSDYLRRKKIPHAGQMIELKKGRDGGGDYFAWGLYDCEGLFCGFERIYDGLNERGKSDKKVCRYSRPAQGFSVLGNLSEASRAFVVGGLADGISVYQSTNECVIVVVGENNLPKIMAQLQTYHPAVEFIAAPDNDQAGLRAAKSSGTRWVVPMQNGDDWNDVFCQFGPEQVSVQINAIKGLTFNHIEQEKMNVNLIEGTLNLIKSAKETGKTYSTAQWVKSRQDLKVLIISYRVSLLNSLARQFDAQFYQDLIIAGTDNNYLKGANRLVITPDSLWRIAGTRWDVVFVDEAEQTLQHFLSSTMKHKTFNLDVFSDVLRTSGTQIVADADLSELTTDFMERINLHSGVYHINHYKPRTGSTLYVYEDISHLEQQSMRWFSEGAHQFICSNSKKRIDNLARQLDKAGWSWGKEYAHISSDNSQTPQVQNLIEHINERAPELLGLLGTPSIGTGLSIDTHHFGKTIGLFGHETGTAEQAHQQLSRARGVMDYHVWVDPKEQNYYTDPDVLERLLLNEPDMETCEFLGIENGKVCIKHELFEWLFCRVKAFLNLNKNQYRQRFISQAKAEGYEVIMVSKNEPLSQMGKKSSADIREQLIKELKEDIDNQPLLSEEQFQAAIHGEGDYSETAIRKTQVFKDLNLAEYDGEDATELLNQLTLGEVTDGTVSSIKKLSISALSVEAARQLDIRNRKFATSRVYLKHYSKRKQHQSQILSAAGLDDELNYHGRVWTSKEAQTLRKWLLRNREEVFKYSGITVTFNALKNPVRWFNDFLRSRGLTVNSKQVRDGDNRVWVYSLDEGQLEFVRKLALLRNQGIEQHLNEAGKEVWAPRMPSVTPAEQKDQKFVTPGTTDLYHITGFGVTEKTPSEAFVDGDFSSVETSELGTKIDDRITDEDWVKMTAESVGVTLEYKVP
ncbi:plasmid replication protein, CyRepA1 family [Candidatus Williamhamiltonella defendens]|nr:plasmid replication protein, CyRepA1 family [Candidatus Hamiltonella defensa]